MIIELMCQNLPTDRQTRKAKRFGEGFVWKCPLCGDVFVMTQGKGSYWYWKRKEDI